MENEARFDLTFKHFLCLWFGAAVSMAEIMTGGLLAPLGFKSGLFVIFIGHAIGTTILVGGGVIGTRERLPALTSTRISFGLYGSYLFSLFNLLQLIGWTAVMIISAARSVNLISIQLWHFSNIPLWSILIGGMVCGWVLSGKTGFKKINVIAVALLFILTVALSWVVFRSNKLWSGAVSIPGASWGEGLELNIIMPLSWLPLIADYTRFAKSTKSGVFGSWIGYFLASSWMYLIGLATAIVSGNPDPTGMMLATNLGLAALGIVILATVTTTFLDVYSAGVTFLNVFPRFNGKSVAVIMGIVGIIVAILVPIEQYENFLYAIGSIFAPLFAILLTDYFLVKPNSSGPTVRDDLLMNWGALFIWILGMLLYYYFIKIGFILGATLPAMVLTGLIHYLSARRLSNWKTCKPSLNC